MKVRIKSTGQVVDIVATADTFLFMMCGLVEEVKPEPMDWRKQRKNGTAQWSAGFTSGHDRRPCITAHCDACNAYQLFLENDRIVNATTGLFHHRRCRRRSSSTVAKKKKSLKTSSALTKGSLTL
jgi:hypothetical protein